MATENTQQKIKPETNENKVATVNAQLMDNKTKVLQDDPRFRIRPLQQVASACTGAMLTATFSKLLTIILF